MAGNDRRNSQGNTGIVCRLLWAEGIEMLTMRCCLLSWILPSIAALCSAGQACCAVESAELFDTEVKLILDARCVECHGTDVREGGLDLSQRDGLLAGGESGPAVVPGSPDASLLLQKIRSGAMPPDDTGLSPDSVASLERWIAAGALTAGEKPSDRFDLFGGEIDAAMFVHQLLEDRFSVPGSFLTFMIKALQLFRGALFFVVGDVI